MSQDDPQHSPESGAYRVLARKYRPQSFDDLIGQEAMVRILSAAFDTGRIAHGFMLTGVRGVGKTTTARLIARALNYTDGQGNSTPSLHFKDPGVHCEAIAASRHMDVLEMDAASRTGIDDIREIIERAKFKPASAPYKVYIIDEVHMLSKAAFNGLLKILEEPPAHVKFIFATTEVRKVPVTVLSRCQRFDLRRIEPDVMIAHLKSVADKEDVAVEEGALALIARGSEGSVRDALSLLDQAIAHGAADKAAISEEAVRDMMGLADRERVLDLFDHLMAGRIKDALDELHSQYDLGADPLEVLRDLLDVTHWLTRVQATGEASQEAGLSATQTQRGLEMAKSLSVPVLTRAWQILLKGLREAQSAPRPLAAADMVLVRLAHISDLPTPEEAIKKLSAGDASSSAGSGASNPASGGGATMQARPQPVSQPSGQPTTSLAVAETAPRAHLELHTFDDVMALIREQRNIRLQTDVESYLHLVRFEQGHIEFRPAAGAPENLATNLAQTLSEWTGMRWMVSVSNEAGAPTLHETQEQARMAQEAELKKDPLVQAAFTHFPDSKVVEIRERDWSDLDDLTEDMRQTDSDDDI